MNISRAVPRISFFYRRYRQGQRYLRIAAGVMLTAVFSTPQFSMATTVHMVIVTGTATLGTIDVALCDDQAFCNDQAPITVANFLRYAGRGDYNLTIIHRHATISPDGVSVIQGGGYATIPPSYLYDFPKDPPIRNEFSPLRPNVRGTIAMAKLGNNPDSATSEWYINLDNNPALDEITNDGGFTVFGSVLDPGMTVVDTIANFSTQPAYMPVITQGTITSILFSELPLVDPTIGPSIGNLVVVSSIPNVTASKTLTTQTTSAYAADPDVTLQNPNHNTLGSISYTTVDETTSTSWLAAFTPPPGKTVQFNDEISQFKMTWPAGSPATRVVTLYHGANAGVSGYYAYGPTPNNPTPHWYDFSYDGQTGAEIVGNKILLHFVKGQRGDDDFATNNNSITHTGAPVLVTDITTSSSSSSGCSIAATPTPLRGNGDWIVVSIFLVFVALVRRRSCRDRI